MAIKHARTAEVDDSGEDENKINASNWNADHTIEDTTITEAKLSLADNTTANATTSAHGLVVKATAPAANVLNVVGIANGETAYTNKAIFDATNPAAIGSASPGTSLIAAHRDHVHAASHTNLSDIGTLTHTQIDTQVGYRYKYPMDFRLTLESGVPVSSADQSAKTTLYLTPYIGNQIALYYDSAWVTYEASEMSLSLSGYTSGRVYDIWCYSNSGTPTLASTIWTNATTRGTALTIQDGVLVKSGATNYRYIGTIYMSGSGQCSDTTVIRGVWNFYNQVTRGLYNTDVTSHSYSTESFRKWNNSDSGNLLKYVTGRLQNVMYMVGVTIRADATDSDCLTTIYVDGVDIYAYCSNQNLGYCGIGNNTSIKTAEGYHYFQVYEYGSTAADFQAMQFSSTLEM